MRPLLAHIYEPHRVTYPCFVQPKLNGIRALYQNGCFQSRDQLPFPTNLLRHLSEPLLQVFGPKTILDGELYFHEWNWDAEGKKINPLQRINAAVTPIRLAPTEDTLKVEYHVFDVVDYQRSFESRIAEPFATLAKNEVHQVYRVPTCQGSTEGFADYAYARFVQEGYEGMMYRLGDCPYTVPKQDGSPLCSGTNNRARKLSDKDNRCWHLLKRKDWQDDEFDFVSINETIGELGNPGFQVWCYARNGKLFKLGGGLTRAEVIHYLANPPVGRKVKGKYLVLSNDGIPLNPTILAIL